MDCIFCRIAKGEIPADMVYSDAGLIAIRDIHPQAPVHLLIIPIKHIETILDLRRDDSEIAGQMILLANLLAKQEGVDIDGFRLVFNCKRNAGQEVFHIHLHMLGGRIFSWPPG